MCEHITCCGNYSTGEEQEVEYSKTLITCCCSTKMNSCRCCCLPPAAACPAAEGEASFALNDDGVVEYKE
jgi:hypothetical protein